MCYYLLICLDDVPNILSNIKRLKHDLTNIIEPDFGLLDHLLSMDVLTRREYDDIRSETRAAYRRSEAMLDLLVSEDQCDKFLKALQQTEQQHIVNFISQNGGQEHCSVMNCEYCCKCSIALRSICCRTLPVHLSDSSHYCTKMAERRM